MPINRDANNHNVAGISQRKEYDVSPMLVFLQCDVKLCQQVKSRGKESQRFAPINLNRSQRLTSIKESDKDKHARS